MAQPAVEMRSNGSNQWGTFHKSALAETPARRPWPVGFVTIREPLTVFPQPSLNSGPQRGRFGNP